MEPPPEKKRPTAPSVSASTAVTRPSSQFATNNGLVFMIFSFLSLHVKCRLLRISKSMRTILVTTSLNWRLLDVRCLHVPLPSILAYITYAGTQLKDVRLDGF